MKWNIKVLWQTITELFGLNRWENKRFVDANEWRANEDVAESGGKTCEWLRQRPVSAPPFVLSDWMTLNPPRQCLCSYLLTLWATRTACRRSPGPRWTADTGPTCSSSAAAAGTKARAWRQFGCWPVDHIKEETVTRCTMDVTNYLTIDYIIDRQRLTLLVEALISSELI